MPELPIRDLQDVSPPQPAAMRFLCVRAQTEFGVGYKTHSARLVAEGESKTGFGRVDLWQMTEQLFIEGMIYQFVPVADALTEPASSEEIKDAVLADAVLDPSSPPAVDSPAVDSVEVAAAEPVAVSSVEIDTASVVATEEPVAEPPAETPAVQDSVPASPSASDTPTDTLASPASEVVAESLPAVETVVEPAAEVTAVAESPAVAVDAPVAESSVAGTIQISNTRQGDSAAAISTPAASEPLSQSAEPEPAPAVEVTQEPALPSDATSAEAAPAVPYEATVEAPVIADAPASPVDAPAVEEPASAGDVDAAVDVTEPPVVEASQEAKEAAATPTE